MSESVTGEVGVVGPNPQDADEAIKKARLAAEAAKAASSPQGVAPVAPTKTKKNRFAAAAEKVADSAATAPAAVDIEKARLAAEAAAKEQEAAAIKAHIASAGATDPRLAPFDPSKESADQFAARINPALGDLSSETLTAENVGRLNKGMAQQAAADELGGALDINPIKDPKTAGSIALHTLVDAAQFAPRVAENIVGGTWDFVNMFDDWLGDNMASWSELATKASVGGKPATSFYGHSSSPMARMATSVTAFVIPFGGLSKASAGARAALPGVAGLHRTLAATGATSLGGKVVASAMSGAARSAVVENVFSRQFSNLNTALNDMGIESITVDVLVHDKDDSEIERRIKNTMESAGLGALVGAFIGGFQQLKRLQVAKAEGVPLESINAKMNSAEALAELVDTSLFQKHAPGRTPTPGAAPEHVIVELTDAEVETVAKILRKDPEHIREAVDVTSGLQWHDGIEWGTHSGALNDAVGGGLKQNPSLNNLSSAAKFASLGEHPLLGDFLNAHDLPQRQLGRVVTTPSGAEVRSGFGVQVTEGSLTFDVGQAGRELSPAQLEDLVIFRDAAESRGELIETVFDPKSGELTVTALKHIDTADAAFKLTRTSAARKRLDLVDLNSGGTRTTRIQNVPEAMPDVTKESLKKRIRPSWAGSSPEIPAGEAGFSHGEMFAVEKAVDKTGRSVRNMYGGESKGGFTVVDSSGERFVDDGSKSFEELVSWRKQIDPVHPKGAPKVLISEIDPATGFTVHTVGTRYRSLRAARETISETEFRIIDETERVIHTAASEDAMTAPWVGAWARKGRNPIEVIRARLSALGDTAGVRVMDEALLAGNPRDIDAATLRHYGMKAYDINLNNFKNMADGDVTVTRLLERISRPSTEAMRRSKRMDQKQFNEYTSIGYFLKMTEELGLYSPGERVLSQRAFLNGQRNVADTIAKMTSYGVAFMNSVGLQVSGFRIKLSEAMGRGLGLMSEREALTLWDEGEFVSAALREQKGIKMRQGQALVSNKLATVNMDRKAGPVSATSELMDGGAFVRNPAEMDDTAVKAALDAVGGLEAVKSKLARQNEMFRQFGNKGAFALSNGLRVADTWTLLNQMRINFLLTGLTTQSINVLGNASVAVLNPLATGVGTGLQALWAKATGNVDATAAHITAFSDNLYQTGEFLKTAWGIIAANRHGAASGEHIARAFSTGESSLLQGANAVDRASMGFTAEDLHGLFWAKPFYTLMNKHHSGQLTAGFDTAASAVGHTATTATRGLAAMDEFFKNITARAAAKRMVRRKHLNENILSGEELDNAIAEDTNKIFDGLFLYSKQRIWDEGMVRAGQDLTADQLANPEMFQNYMNRHMEREFDDELSRITDESSRIAREWTFTQDVGTGALGGVAKGLLAAKGGKYGQVSRVSTDLLFPFVTVPTNLARTGHQWTPLDGVSAGLRTAFRSATKRASPAVAEEANHFIREIRSGDAMRAGEAIGKLALGSAFVYGMYSHVSTDGSINQEGMTITGAAPRDPQLAAAWASAGILPYSLYWNAKLQGGWNNIDPAVAYPLGLVVASATALDKDDYDSEDDTGPLAATLGVARAASDKAYFQSFVDFITAFDSRSDKPFERVLHNTMASFVVPNIVTGFRNATDQFQREIGTFTDTLADKTPLTSTDLGYKHNGFGERIVRNRRSGVDTIGPIANAVSPIKTGPAEKPDTLLAELGENGIFPTVSLTRTIDGHSLNLKDDELRDAKGIMASSRFGEAIGRFRTEDAVDTIDTHGDRVDLPAGASVREVVEFYKNSMPFAEMSASRVSDYKRGASERGAFINGIIGDLHRKIFLKFAEQDETVKKVLDTKKAKVAAAKVVTPSVRKKGGAK